MSAVYPESDLAAAWESGYWHGTSHEGPLNDAAVAAKNPYKKSGLDTPAKKSVQTATETPANEEIPVNHTTKYPATVREAGDMAHKLGMKLSEFLEMISPIPTSPVGYTMDSNSSDRWIGDDIANRNYMITPVWNATTNQRTLELWGAKYSPEDSSTHLTPLEAIQLASDLIKLAKDALADDAAGSPDE